MPKLTKAIEIQRSIADDIVHGRRLPGMPLDEVTLAMTFKVSRTPIREAIRQLEMSGLVEARPHRGAIVSDIAKERLDSMFAVMSELEAVCSRWAAETMTDKERRELRMIHDTSGEDARRGRREAYVEANYFFHTALYDGSHNSFLAETTRHVRDRLAPFRRAQFEAKGRLVESFTEHERIVTAIERHDAVAADAAMRAHMGFVRTKVLHVTAVDKPAAGAPRRETAAAR